MVAHVIHRLDFGGLENGLVNLVNHMPANRFRHAVICLAGFNEQFRARIRREDVEVTSIGKRPGKDFMAYARVWKEFVRLKPAIVHTRNLGTIDLQWIAALAGVRHRVHGEHGWEATDAGGTDRRRIRIRRACAPVIQRYVPVSRDLARWLQCEVGVPASRIRQLYNGVDTEKFIPAQERIALPDGSERSGLESRTAAATISVGTVGRLDPVKNHAALLRAVRSLTEPCAARGLRLKLLIVGDGPLRSQLESLAGSLGLSDVVHFPGARNDAATWLRAMDVFVLPSLNEGISNTILEAMATGLPVVAAQVGGNAELVVHGGTGMLYEAGRPGALEDAILQYVIDRDLRRRHGTAARQRAVECFSLDGMIQRYLDLYDEILYSARIVHARKMD